MNDLLIAAIVLFCIILAAAFSRRIQGTILTMPIIYVVIGLLLSDLGFNVISPGGDSELVQIVAEITLVLVLFSDASRISIKGLINNHKFPVRLLSIGLPLTMLLGTFLASLIFDTIIFAEAAIVGILLAPTDASLGQAVITNKLVPQRIRQTLNVESGLNDGIAMPFLLMALAIATAEEFGGLGQWIRFGAAQIIVGTLGGVVMGFLSAKFLNWGKSSGWMTKNFRKISLIALALMAYALTDYLGGNGFIAAFVAGITTGHFIFPEDKDELNEHVEVEVDLLILLTFMIVFGAFMLPDAIRLLDWKIVLYAVLSLTIVRMLPVAIALMGTNLKKQSVAFLGWFGPRGAASILYLFTVIEAEELTGLNTVYAATLITVLLSVFVHGISAAPAARWYGQMMSSAEIGEEAPEMMTVPTMPHRGYRQDM